MSPLQRLANLTLTYLSRTKLEGNEVPTFVEVHNWLTQLAQAPVTAEPEPAIVPVPQPEELPNG